MKALLVGDRVEDVRMNWTGTITALWMDQSGAVLVAVKPDGVATAAVYSYQPMVQYVNAKYLVRLRRVAAAE